MLVNRKLASSTAKSSCGTGGVPTTVTITLPVQPTSVTLRQLDKNSVNCSTNAAIAPTTQTLTPTQTQTITFPGYGIAVLNVNGSAAPLPPAPNAALTPSSESFGSQQVASTSAAHTVTVTNTGTAALSMSSVGVTGANAGDFARTSTCPLSPSTLAVGASCTVSVTFTPSATGSRTATLNLADNASSSPQTVALSGSGVVSPPLLG